MLNNTNKIILDTDPGIDDAIAMVVLLHHCKERVVQILTSYGNISIDKTTNNALTILSLLDCDIPVVQGVDKPYDAEFTDASHIHGVDGLGGLSLDLPKQNAVEGDFLQITYDRIIECGKVDYITLGPLTNLALLLRRFPDVKGHIDNVITMGGGLDKGNVTEFAEFNIHCDPLSADYVFQTAKKLTLVPLNTTLSVFFSLEQIKKIGAFGTPLARAMEKILTSNYNSCTQYGENGSTMHDATAVLYYVYNDIFALLPMSLEVDCKHNLGETKENSVRRPIYVTGQTSPPIMLDKITECII